MFSLEVVDTDRFLDMPASTQALYFHLGMRADDDGFVAAPRKIIAMCNCSADDLRILISKNYVIPFKSGVCVVTDWLKNNHLASNRKTPTEHQRELRTLGVVQNAYVVKNSEICESGKNWFENEGGGGESILCVESEGKSLSNKQVYETGDYSPDTPLDSSPNLSSIYPPIIPPLSSSPAPSSSLPSTPSPKETVLSVLSSFNFGEELEETVRDWLEYKREKRQNYKAVGLKTLLGQIKRYAERYGDDAMIELIRDSMASNYQGITFDRLKRAPVRSGDRLSWIDEVKLD